MRRIQAKRKRRAVEQAKRAPFYAGKLDHIDLDRLDDADEWRKIPILDKDMLRAPLRQRRSTTTFCLKPDDGIAEFWRSGGATGAPLFYPRSFDRHPLRHDGLLAHLSMRRLPRPADARMCRFRSAFIPSGQMLARCATDVGIAVNWAGSGTTTPSVMQIELIDRLKPTIWMGMSSYGLHLANLAEARGLDLAASSVKTILCSAEPLSDAKRAKARAPVGRAGARHLRHDRSRHDGRRGCRRRRLPHLDRHVLHRGASIPTRIEPVGEGEIGCLVVTPLWTNNVTPFLRWSSGDLVTFREGEAGEGPFSVFPLVKHAHRTTGFFKVRGINLNHAELEDFMFRNRGRRGLQGRAGQRARSRRAAPLDRGAPRHRAVAGLGRAANIGARYLRAHA